MQSLILVTDIIEKIILLVLIGLSIWSVSIMIERRRFYKKHFNLDDFKLIQNEINNTGLASDKNLKNSNFFVEVYNHFAIKNQPSVSIQHVDRSYSSFIKDHKEQLEKGLNILATLGANAPFIGLFGTVLGIIRAMAYLGNQSGSASVVSGVSQALYATAIGLFVAIPAVVAFNYFNYQIKKSCQKAESLKDLYIVKNQLR
jgi:biopolymer transport protein ExbB/TolQ